MLHNTNRLAVLVFENNVEERLIWDACDQLRTCYVKSDTGPMES